MPRSTKMRPEWEEENEGNGGRSPRSTKMRDMGDDEDASQRRRTHCTSP